MSTPLDRYLKIQTDGEAGRLTLEDWNGAISEIGGALAELRQKAAGFDAVSQVAIEILLQRVNEVLGPAFASVGDKAAQVDGILARLNGQGVSADAVIPSATRTLVTPEQRALIDTAAQITNIAAAVAGRYARLKADKTLELVELPAASVTAQGIVELATSAETIAGTDTERAVTPIALAAVVAATGPFFKYTAFTAGGTFTPDPRTKSVFVECFGAGGSGTGATTGGSGGGCGGQYTRSNFSAASVGASQAVLVGSGGNPVSGNGIAGNPGGNSSFGSLLKAYGGSGGPDTNNLNSAATLVDPTNGTNRWRTVGTGGAEFGSGASGGVTPVAGLTTYGGGGGGGNSTLPGGISQVHGSGGAGSNSGAGAAGSVPGGGGGGSTNGALSGAGARGEVRVWEFG